LETGLRRSRVKSTFGKPGPSESAAKRERVKDTEIAAAIPAHRRAYGGRLILGFLLGAGLVLLRLIHLDADSPAGMSWSAGIYVDEGYKTLAPRNLILFGTTHWNDADDYRGWMEGSPLTQWSFYAGFKLFGVKITSARLVTVFYTAFLLSLYAVALRDRYRPWVYFTGLLALGLESTVFFFSRVALFEIPLALFLYGLLFALSRVREGRVLLPVLLIIAVGTVASFAVKKSAMLYITPVLAGAGVYLAVKSRHYRDPKLWLLAGGAAAVLGVFMLLTTGIWAHRVEISPISILTRVLAHPIAACSPFVVLLGLVCATTGLLAKPELYLGNLYRGCLLSVVLLGPPLLAAFSYNPLRYYVPIVPAYILLAVEWLHLEGWKSAAPKRSGWILAVVVIALLALLAFHAGNVSYQWILGEDALAKRAPHLSLLPWALVVALAAWRWRHLVFNRRGTSYVVAAIALLLAVQSAYSLGSFFLFPSYRSGEIRAEISKLVGDGESMGGDWAPFFALGTGIKALYINHRINAPERLREVAPKYYLYNKGRFPELRPDKVARAAQVSMSPPLLRAKYIGRKVALYQVFYD
jgi:hypothetical protein